MPLPRTSTMSQPKTTLVRPIRSLACWTLAILTTGTLLIPATGADDEPEDAKLKRLEKFYADQAQQQTFFRDAEHTQPLTLESKPVYSFGGTEGGGGSTFVWTWQGRPQIVGAIFSAFWGGKRHILHEFHSITPEILHPKDPKWVPQAGIRLTTLDDASPPADSPAARLIQLRQLAREFSAYSIDEKGDRWEMRLLPRPLYRYDVKSGPVIDGALFAWVTTKSTDPEIFLLLEANKNDTGAAQWQYALARFSHHNLHVDRAGKEVWTALIGPNNGVHDNKEGTYYVVEVPAPDEE